MKLSKLFFKTLKEVPGDAEAISHVLLLRAGYIRRLSSGIYTYLPLAKRVLLKIENIVREEMININSQELLLPALQPREIWEISGRWKKYGLELMRFKDRHDKDYALGPTHEEVITDLINREVNSYKQLPISVFQIQTKFRDEIRPRFGLMRTREFIMKDAYSFHRNEEDLDKTYWDMFHAYEKILTRMGLNFKSVEADSGAIGGSVSHEFMVLTPFGEDKILYCSSCSYAANLEKATSTYEPFYPNSSELSDIDIIPTPNARTVNEVSEYIGVDQKYILKSLMYRVDGKPTMIVIAGDDELNEVKLKNALSGKELSMMTPEEIKQELNLNVGSIGPVKINNNIDLICDKRICVENVAFYAGANKEGYHYKNVYFKRDFYTDKIFDLRISKAGEFCSRCGSRLLESTGSEAGHVFKLGTKYSEPMKAYFKDEDGKEKPFEMGCYGIGISRLLAIVVEQHHDEFGIIWPNSISPYQVIIIPTNINDKNQLTTSEMIFYELKERGISVLFDDRDERAGVKFKDADLLGIPIKIIIGSHFSKSGLVEIKVRRDGSSNLVPPDEASVYVSLKLRQII
ncbi:Prolyl-tRNA synthetase [Thermodesulfobium narugense DSM 14796]|uniref:Proline--tRNA ligase n=1 Tax=Thermodesulfobium narugense DSM 14796 TaxID=747365 RepID=M1E4P0_9BACT|nr:proline--tRNA ligase [Thermodesulfobium narugense]AEE14352.1 Prolyl-tRNA synthetase [Thermodesulfobium narugense DSM 14796]